MRAASAQSGGALERQFVDDVIVPRHLRTLATSAPDAYP
jgi:hypothetical protein